MRERERERTVTIMEEQSDGLQEKQKHGRRQDFWEWIIICVFVGFLFVCMFVGVRICVILKDINVEYCLQRSN